MGTPLRFAIFGTGFWARFQLCAWRELEGAQCVALYNRTLSKARRLGEEFGIDAVYDDPERLLREQAIDFVDIITDNATHEQFTRLAAAHGRHVICQKPFADTVAQAEGMLAACRAANVRLAIHENWRWQAPIRRFAEVLRDGAIGTPFRARIHYCNSFPVFANQPFLATLPRFILMDIGTHILDAARFLFGEATSVYCRTHRVNPAIHGEDVATAVMPMRGGMTVVCEMSYASRTEIERFPQTYVYVEGDRGFAELGPDYWIRVTTADGTHAVRRPPPRYAWADPAYDCIHAAIVDCCRDCRDALLSGRDAETSGADNLRTLRLVEACYASAERGEAVTP